MPDADPDNRTRVAAMAGAFGGVSLLFISVILGQQSPLDLQLRLGLCGFACSLPFAVLAFVLAYMGQDNSVFTVAFWMSFMTTAIGIGTALWHMDALALWVYIGAIGLAFLGFWRFNSRAAP